MDAVRKHPPLSFVGAIPCSPEVLRVFQYSRLADQVRPLHKAARRRVVCTHQTQAHQPAERLRASRDIRLKLLRWRQYNNWYIRWNNRTMICPVFISSIRKPIRDAQTV